MSTEDHIHELLQLSMLHLDNATDPAVPDACFRPYLTIGALAAQAAYLLGALVKHAPAEELNGLIAEMTELGVDGEVLVSWVGQELNRERT